MNFKKELIGVKRNTVRIMKLSERFKLYELIESHEHDICIDEKTGLLEVNSDAYITIHNSETGEYFTRKLKDISTLDTGMNTVFIFSW
jgi:hypothetical protein